MVRALLTVVDVGEVTLPAPVARLVAWDRNETRVPLVEVIGDDPLDDPFDVSQEIRSSACTWQLAVCCAQKATRPQSSGCAGGAAEPRDGIDTP